MEACGGGIIVRLTIGLILVKGNENQSLVGVEVCIIEKRHQPVIQPITNERGCSYNHDNSLNQLPGLWSSPTSSHHATY